jgi:hypothetical protein
MDQEDAPPEGQESQTVEVNVRGLMGIFQGCDANGAEKGPVGGDSTGSVSIKCEGKTCESSNSSPLKTADLSRDQSAGRCVTMSESVTSEEIDIVLNPAIKEQAIKALFPEYKGELDRSVHRAGVKGTRRHRRSTLGLVRDRSSDLGDTTKTALKSQPTTLGLPATTQKPLVSRGNSSEPGPTKELQKVRKLHGKSHPLSRLVQEATCEGSTTQGRSKNPFYNTL